MSIKLNTSNPDKMIYRTDEIIISILGGIRLDSLDRLRVTIKIEIHNRKFKEYLNNPDLANTAVRHNIDLYNDNQVEKLIRKTADKLETGITSLSKHISILTDQLEEYRIKKLQEKQPEQNKKKKLTPEQEQQAKEYLSAPELMERTIYDIGKSGVIGEETNRLLMYIIFTSRKREYPLHVVSLGSSGTGKTYLQEKVSELIPEEDKMEITVLSENAFYYFGQTELRNKLILIEDLDGLSAGASGVGGSGALYPLRELQTKRKISKTVAHKNTKGVTKTISMTVEGPVSVAGCTTKEKLYEDNANRSFLIYIDESKEQDEKIMDYQRKRSAGKTDATEENKIKESFRNMQRVLQPITVINPFAEYLKIPEEVFKPRRTNTHYLAFIEAITFYHQYQREWKVNKDTGEQYIETTIEDIEQANRLMKETLLRKSDELTGACRSYFEKLKLYMKERDKTGSSSFGGSQKGVYTMRDIRNHLRISSTTLKRHQNELLHNGLVEIIKEDKTKGYQYQIISYEEYELMKKGIDSILDNILNDLKKTKRSTGPVVDHSPDGPLNNKNPKTLKSVVR